MGQVTRRELFTMGRNLAMGAAAVSILPRPLFGNAISLPVGIQLYEIRDQMAKDVPGSLKMLHDIGYREVETASFGKYSAEDFGKLLEDAGLKAPSAHVRLSGDDLSAVFANVHALGAKYATSSSLATSNPRPAGVPPPNRPNRPILSQDDFMKLADQMNTIGKKAREAGLRYAYHNHNYEFVKMPNGKYGYDLLLEHTDHELVKFEVDCGWMRMAGADPLVYFKKHPGRFKMLHVKEFKPTPSTTGINGAPTPEGTDLGSGFIDYTPIFVAAHKAGIEHAFSEQEDPFPVSSLESAKVDFKFLHEAK